MNNFTIKQAKKSIYFCNSYNRLEAIFNLYGRMRFSSWLRVLGENWTICDNISQFSMELRMALDGSGTIYELMTRTERRRFDQLPDVVTIYRGCGEHNQDGLSWSLDKAVAEKFPFMMRYQAKHPLLVTATVEKEDIIALKTGASESEVITLHPNAVSVVKLLGASAPVKKIDFEHSTQERETR